MNTISGQRLYGVLGKAGNERSVGCLDSIISMVNCNQYENTPRFFYGDYTARKTHLQQKMCFS